MIKRYADAERPTGQCYDCGLEYSGPAWVDVLVSDDVWEVINPTYHEGAGLLCFNCIARRCVEAGLEGVPIALVSGPLIAGKVLGSNPLIVVEAERF